ncbi:MAG: twitch domain-containing radical SAM protein, partial [Halobacteriovoraceae bacterium]|nr:twitch domain-containing radical SAM protein [Halobacteriovoraceae bacterium]
EFKVGPDKNTMLCCHASKPLLSKSNRPYSIDKFSLDEIWNSEGMRNIRKKMLLGEKIDACSYCYYQSHIGGISKRESFNNIWLNSSFETEIIRRILKSKNNNYLVNSPPLYLDISPGNLCNLKCRMCNPTSSSFLYQEQKELLSEKKLDSIGENELLNQERAIYNWHHSSKIWDVIYKWSPKVKALHFKGGEPTLIKKNWELIDFFQRKGHSKTVSLTFNINGTYVPEKLLNTFENFAYVHIVFSVDGYKDIQEYIRYPSKWNIIEKNIIKTLEKVKKKKNVRISFSHVVQVYNILYLTQFLQWVDSLRKKYGKIHSDLLLCTSPGFLDISILPQNVRDLCLENIDTYQKNHDEKKLTSIKNILCSIRKEDSSFQLKKFFEYTSLLDKKRGNNFKKSLPELYESLNSNKPN